MADYFMVIVATVLLALDFSLQKQYQRNAGVSPTAGLTFNALCGLFTALIFWGAGGFRLRFPPFSLVVAFSLAALLVSYNLVGFRLMKIGGIAYYTLFLMTGGMCVPYIWGLAFLGEPFRWLGMVGLLLIIAAVVLSNAGSGRLDAKQLLLCTIVFFFNGFVSVLSKIHQAEQVYSTVGATDFVCLTGLARFVLCTLALLVARFTTKDKQQPHGRPSVVRLAPLIFMSAAVNGVSYVLQLDGAKHLPASALYPIITGGSILFTAFAGMLFFREYPRRLQWLGIALCFIGTCFFL